MKIGDRIYYTGDMANRSSYGTIVAQHKAGKYNQESVDIVYDDPRWDGDTDKKSRMVPTLLFNPGPGRRFYMAEEYDRERQQRIAEFTKKYSKM